MQFSAQDSSDRVKILSEALPYIQKFTGRTVVVKYGGAAMKDESLKENVIRDVVFMACVGIRPIWFTAAGRKLMFG